MAVKTFYLALFNLISAIAWGYTLYTTALSLMEGDKLNVLWKKVALPLVFAQHLAVLEIVHAVTGIVKSPAIITALQVISRLVIVDVIAAPVPAAVEQRGFLLMLFAWCIAEVPRYLYFAISAVGRCPYILVWLRYTNFIYLYPLGVGGEISVIVTSMPYQKKAGVGYWYLCCFLLSMYSWGLPLVYTRMLSQRKKVLYPKPPKVTPPPKGIEFPVDEKGQRSTMVVNQAAFAAAAAVVDDAERAIVEKEKKWRYGYTKHIVRNVELCCRSNKDCVKIAEAGLNYLHKHFDFVLPNGKSVSLHEVMTAPTGKYPLYVDKLYTYTVKGTKVRDPKYEFCVPYQKFGSKDVANLKGKELLEQLDKWAASGTIEPQTRDAIAAVVNNPEYHSTGLAGKCFVLLGAGAAMGPIKVLLELGATIIALDIDRDFVWKRLVGLARDSPGTMIFPIKKPKEELKTDEELFMNAGADLLSHTPLIRDWIIEQEKGKKLIIGGYAYLDSALFVRLSMAMDAIMTGVLAKRKDAAIAFLCSPTDVFVTSDDAHEARSAAIKKIPLWQRLLRAILPKSKLVPNARKTVTSADGAKQFALIDGLVVAQGPNYALAKRIQHWRCILAREAGHLASSNIAPSTATISVLHNPQFAAGYKGMRAFPPMEVFHQELSNSVMTALLLNDVCNPKSMANPAVKLDNQIRMFSNPSFHGGIWRMAFKMNSIGEVTAIIGYSQIYRTYLAAFLAICVGLTSVVLSLIRSRGMPHNW